VIYHMKHRYTQRELLELQAADLETEVRCARRDNCRDNPLLAYARQCEQERDAILRRLAEMRSP
jgi:hypothetical protein